MKKLKTLGKYSKWPTATVSGLAFQTFITPQTVGVGKSRRHREESPTGSAACQQPCVALFIAYVVSQPELGWVSGSSKRCEEAVSLNRKSSHKLDDTGE
jgi:hypothetical protein